MVDCDMVRNTNVTRLVSWFPKRQYRHGKLYLYYIAIYNCITPIIREKVSCHFFAFTYKRKNCIMRAYTQSRIL